MITSHSNWTKFHRKCGYIKRTEKNTVYYFLCSFINVKKQSQTFMQVKKMIQLLFSNKPKSTLNFRMLSKNTGITKSTITFCYFHQKDKKIAN